MAMDIGEQRVGIAMARADVKVPVVVTTLLRSEPDFWARLTQLIGEYEIVKIVLGLPRGLNGQDTAQTESARVFGKELQKRIGLPIAWQDEALTSVKAESMFKASDKSYTKADIDAQAACYILSDYMEASKVTA